jgi:hypothetical protein
MMVRILAFLPRVDGNVLSHASTLTVLPNLFFEFHGIDREVGDQAAMLQSLAAEHDRQRFKCENEIRRYG